MVSYSVTCECGIIYPVSPTAAGLPIDCGCGKSFFIPSLSKLRESAGESPIPLSTIETIQEMIDTGRLPVGDTCPFSGRPVDDSVIFRVQCESEWTEDGDSSDLKQMLAYALFGWIALLFFRNNSEPIKEFGRDTSIEVPLRISSESRSAIVKLRNQSKLKSLLRQTPIYERLLQEFPDAEIIPITMT